MRVRHRGFALILVLLAAAAVFALTLQAAMISRAATIESRIMRDRAEQERGARSAAAMVVTGLGTTVERFAAQTGANPGASSGDGGGGGGGGEEDPERPRIELPEMLKQMLGEEAEKLEKQAKEAVGGSPETDGGGITGRVGRSNRRPNVSIKHLPTEPVIVRLGEGGPVYAVTVFDTSALLNVNKADRRQLERYLTAKEIAPETAAALASQIIDWRDEDNFAEPGGAEETVHRERGVVCRNEPMRALEELKFLPAMTPEIFDLVRGDLTVAGEGRVHIATASREVLLSLPGMDEEAVRRVIEARREGPIQEKDLERVLPLYARDAKEHLTLTGGGILRLRVEAVGDSRAVFEGLAVVSERGIRALGLRPLL